MTTTYRELFTPASRSHDPPKRLTFSPLAWLKFQFLCHAGPTEVAAFGLASKNAPLYLEDILVVRQRCTPVTVAFDDEAVADLFDRMVDAGIPPARFARVWLHTPPGASVEPSHVDEETFQRVFGGCDWAVMGILGRTGNVYARLRFNAGPGGTLLLVGHRPIDPATGAPTPAANQIQVSVEEAVAALDSAEWEFVVAEERLRAIAGTGVDAVIFARRRKG